MTGKLTIKALGMADAGFLREHLATYLLDTYGATDSSPLHLPFWQLVDLDAYARSVASTLARKLPDVDTTGGMLAQGISDAFDLDAARAASTAYREDS